MQSQDLGKPQIPPTFLAGRDFGLYCLLGASPLAPYSIQNNLYHAKTLGERRAARGRQPRRALLTEGVDEDDSEGHEEGDDGEGDL